MYAYTMHTPHDIHDIYRRHRPYCCNTHRTQSCTFGAGAGGWVLLGSMGLWCSRGCHKLYVLARKPLAALHRAAGEPLRHASNQGGIHASTQPTLRTPTQGPPRERGEGQPERQNYWASHDAFVNTLPQDHPVPPISNGSVENSKAEPSISWCV